MKCRRWYICDHYISYHLLYNSYCILREQAQASQLSLLGLSVYTTVKSVLRALPARKNVTTTIYSTLYIHISSTYHLRPNHCPDVGALSVLPPPSAHPTLPSAPLLRPTRLLKVLRTDYPRQRRRVQFKW